jgi:hypothetical protein
MIKKVISGLLTLLVATVLTNPGLAQQTQTPVDKHAQKIRKYVKSLKRWDVGDPVTVKLYDGTKIKGHVTEITDDYFVVTDRKTSQSTSLKYSEVRDVSEGMGTRTKVGLTFAGVILAVVGICAATHRCRE